MLFKYVFIYICMNVRPLKKYGVIDFDQSLNSHNCWCPRTFGP